MFLMMPHFAVTGLSITQGFFFLAHLRMSYSAHFLSVRLSVLLLTFSNDFSSEAAEPILLKFHMEPPKVGGTKGLPKLLK